MKKIERIGSILFYSINAIAILSFLYNLTYSTNGNLKLFGVLIDFIWACSFFTHISNMEILYVEREAYNYLTNQYLKIVKENKNLKEKLKEEKN